MSRLWRAIQDRLNLAPVWGAIQASHSKTRIPLGDAPPVSLGRLAGILLAFLVLSGFGLLLYYEPTADGAAASLASFHRRQPVGWLIHNAHRWSALLLLLVVVGHALRVWLARGYRPPRDLNWWLGLGLLMLTLGMGGTGYLLRWDIKAFTLMELIVGSFSDLPLVGRPLIRAMLGGTTLGEVPLYRGFAFHVWVLPIMLIALIGAHLAIAWRQGLAERPGWWDRLRGRLPGLRLVGWLPGLALLVFVIALSALTPHEAQAGPASRSAWPHPDWILGFYLLPFWWSGQATWALGAAVFPAVLLLFLVLVPRWGNITDTRRWIPFGLAILGTAGVALVLGQVSAIGSTIPSAGCTACHRPGILGGAPTELAEFRVRDLDWLVFHLREPENSILEPARPPDQLP